MQITKSNRYGATSAEGIKEFEVEIGYSLPSDYRMFLLEHNGGFVEAADIDAEDNTEQIDSEREAEQGTRRPIEPRR